MRSAFFVLSEIPEMLSGPFGACRKAVGWGVGIVKNGQETDFSEKIRKNFSGLI